MFNQPECVSTRLFCDVCVEPDANAFRLIC